MRSIFCLILLSSLVACSSPQVPKGWSSGFGSVELAPSLKAPAPDRGDHNGLAETLLGVSLEAIGSGVLADGLGPPPEIAYNEVRMAVARERSDDVRGDVLGLGSELSVEVTRGVFTRLGFWVLEGEEFGSPEGPEVGRLSLGVGHWLPMGESTHLVVSAGFEWERDRKGSVNFFSLKHNSDEGLFGSNDSEFGFDADLTLRHRLTKWLEIDAGIRGETLREDSVGGFGLLRFFLGENAALYFEYEDVDEPTATLGLALIGG